VKIHCPEHRTTLYTLTSNKSHGVMQSLTSLKLPMTFTDNH